jgi:hypothetical protein
MSTAVLRGLAATCCGIVFRFQDINMEKLPASIEDVNFSENSLTELKPDNRHKEQKSCVSNPSKNQSSNSSQDEALELLSSYGGVRDHFSAEQDARLVKKIDRQSVFNPTSRKHQFINISLALCP